ncbi:MAG TPA: hypothetical protein PLR26_06715 [Bacilli bacterium]|nr:hypothetical protein [Bacilli bacterium]
MLLSRDFLVLKQMSLSPQLIDDKLNLYQFESNNTTFLVSFLQTGRKTKIMLYSSRNWKSFLNEDMVLVKLKLVKRSRILKNSVFQKMKAINGLYQMPVVKIIITEHISKTYIMDEHEAEYIKPEDTVDGIHIMNEKRFKKFVANYNADKVNKTSIAYQLGE